MSLDRRISIITLGVKSLPDSTAFYERLGWFKSPASQETVTFIQLKGTVLALYPRENLAEDLGVETLHDGFSGVTLAHNVSSSAGVDAVVKFAISCGAVLVKTPAKTVWGGYCGYLADPDGYVWEIAHNPHFPMNGQGHVQLPE